MAGLRAEHVNYLIWRYLQESGMPHTAVQLMRDWHPAPQSLPFAHVVKPHDLISLLQDGLAFDDISSQSSSTAKRYEFLEPGKRLPAQPVSPDTADNAADLEATARSRKRPKLDLVPCDDRRKRASTANQHASEDAMDVDEVNVAIDAMVEEPSFPTTADIGKDQGVQSSEPYAPKPIETIAMFDLPTADILNLTWPKLGGRETLFAAGSKICRSFDITSKSGVGGSVNTSQYDEFRNVTVPCLAIDSVGRKLAMATDDTESFSIVLQGSTDDGQVEQASVAAGAGTVIVLSFNPSTELLLYATQSYGDGADARMFNQCSLVRPTTTEPQSRYSTDTPVEDATWVDDNAFIVCGEGMLELLQVRSNQIQARGAIETNALWSSVKYDNWTRRACCVSPEDSHVALLNVHLDTFSYHNKASHGGEITALEWQPLPRAVNAPAATTTADAVDRVTEVDVTDDIRMLATSSIDGTIKLWNARNDLECLVTLAMDSGAPVMALAFSPDGKHVAGAGGERVCIWLVQESLEAMKGPDRECRPFATWPCPELSDAVASTEPGLGWPLDDRPFHVLAWNASGEFLAYSSGDKIAVMRLPKAHEQQADDAPPPVLPVEPTSDHRD